MKGPMKVENEVSILVSGFKENFPEEWTLQLWSEVWTGLRQRIREDHSGTEKSRRKFSTTNRENASEAGTKAGKGADGWDDAVW